MKKRIKSIFIFLSICLLIFCSTACDLDKDKTNIAYYDDIENGYNVDLFYENEIDILGADPGCLYIDDGGEYDGYFFMYPTSDFEYDCKGIVGYKSKDLHNWESVGAVFTPQSTSYITSDVWAPEVIYDKDADPSEYGLESTKNGVYYLFFNSNDQYFLGSEDAELVFDSKEDEALYKTLIATTASQATISATLDEYVDFYQIDDEKVQAYDRRGYSNFYTSYIENKVDTTSALYDKNHLEDIIDCVIEYYEIKDDLANNLTLANELYIDVLTTPTTILNDFGIGLAVSTSPAGPFVQYTRETPDEGERTITIKDMFLSSEDMTGYANGWDLLEDYEAGFAMIDASPFVDPSTGDKYLYFVRRHCSDSAKETNFVCGIKMGESWSDDPDWSTLTRLTKCNVTTVNGSEVSDTEDSQSNNRINEGPNMYYDSDSQEYILTYSVNKLSNRSYSVAQAISTNGPLGDFTKVKKEDGGYILYADGRTGISGAGHHAIVRYKDKLYIVYHAHYNSTLASGQRGICADELYLTKNNAGQTILQCNGPTNTPQPLIDNVAEYTNIIGEADITATNCDESTIEYLSDGKIAIYSFTDIVKEFNAKSGKTEITISFEDYKTVRAIMVYNSKSSETMFNEVDKIQMDYVDEEGNSKQAIICNLQFNSQYIDDRDVLNQCSSCIAEFDELKVNKITLTFKSDTAINISEIRILGK